MELGPSTPYDTLVRVSLTREGFYTPEELRLLRETGAGTRGGVPAGQGRGSMRRATWPVVDDDVRPARPDGTCFWCLAPLGQEHERGCAARRRTVIVEATLRWVESVSEDWMNEKIADYVATDLEGKPRHVHLAFADIIDHEAFAEVTGARYVREATAEEEMAMPPGDAEDNEP